MNLSRSYLRFCLVCTVLCVKRKEAPLRAPSGGVSLRGEVLELAEAPRRGNVGKFRFGGFATNEELGTCATVGYMTGA